MDILSVLKSYNLKNLTIGVLGGHSALDVCAGAKKHGFKTVCIAKKGRELTYNTYYKTDNEKGCIDECIVVDKWSDLLTNDVQERLRSLNTIFIHSRYFWVYFDFIEIEERFNIPIFGSRSLLKLEERDVPKNQYYLLEKAGIRIPKIWETPVLKTENGKLKIENSSEDINKLTLTKVNNAVRIYERENFIAGSWNEWVAIANEKIARGEITLEALQASVIEEFVLGAQINFNFFYSNLTGKLELLGTDTRRQTSLDGFLRLPASEQKKIPNYKPYHIETGHIAVTCKESLLEKAFKAGEDFVKSCKENAQAIIGPFALQGAIETDGKKEELVVFDVSMRIPGSPGVSATPYSGYLYGRSVSMGERVAMEIKKAVDEGVLEKVLT